MPAQIIQRAFGGRQGFDVEPLEQGARQKRLGRELRLDPVVIQVSRLRRQKSVKAKQMLERVV